MTANKKIEEAEYNFLKMVRIEPPNKEFNFELSNFLSSTKSIMDHLLEEYNIKYKLNLKRLNIDKFMIKAVKTKNSDAVKFIQWYDDQLNQIKNDQACSFLINARNLNVHQDQVTPRLTAGNAIIDNSDPNNRKIIDLGSLWFFEGYFHEDARVACKRFLDKITTVVILAHSLF